jgi:D-alanyl-D-alanine carboxypeptidase
MKRITRIGSAALAILSLALGAPSAARAAPVSEIVMDANSGETLRTENADLARPPASLAKLMTLLLVFEALDAGTLKQSGSIVMTPAGERQQPSRLGLRRGRSISVNEAMRAIAVISANDIAVAMADRLAGSEAAFVRRMNAKAAELGMESTRFGNATGLEPSAGRSSARDMALLARYIIRTYPARYKLFATRSIKWGGATRPSHNKLLGKVRGVDGLKTGYTVAAGFNLVASAKRDGKRVIVVVMGSRTAPERDLLVANLVEVGFSEPVLKPARRRRR